MTTRHPHYTITVLTPCKEYVKCVINRFKNFRYEHEFAITQKSIFFITWIQNTHYIIRNKTASSHSHRLVLAQLHNL